MAVEITISYTTSNHEKSEQQIVRDNSLQSIQANSFFMIHDPRIGRDYYIGEHPSKKYGVVFEGDKPVSPTQRFYRLLHKNTKLRLIHKITPNAPWPPVIDSEEKQVSLGVANSAIRAVFIPRKSS